VADVGDSLVGRTADRGFTEHEHLDEIGVVHMNGRIYDPLVGRFMSADPFIQAPSMLQSYNRYAYVMNNPLNLTDPSGYSWWTKIRGTVVRAVAAVADVYFCYGYCSAAVGAHYGAQNGGGLAGGVVGGLRGYFGYHYGGDFSATGYAISAAGGCASAAVNGGNCGRGAAVGVVDHFGSQYGIGGTAAAGCVSSRINGGSCGELCGQKRDQRRNRHLCRGGAHRERGELQGITASVRALRISNTSRCVGRSISVASLRGL
jgi:RHS repeat-associated protein